MIYINDNSSVSTKIISYIVYCDHITIIIYKSVFQKKLCEIYTNRWNRDISYLLNKPDNFFIPKTKKLKKLCTKNT